MLRCLLPVMALAASACLAAGCATVPKRDPLQVTVAGVEPLQGAGMELRMLVKLRVQNPNDEPVDYNGVSVEMDVQGKSFASGVSDAQGSVPRFGEAVIDVPVTASAFRMAGQALGMLRGGGTGLGGKINYEMRGKLSGAGSGSTRFETKGELELPTASALGSPAP